MRRGFTLIELMVTIALSGVVAVLAYGSIGAGIDSSRRIEAYRQSGESAATLRSFLSDALRHHADAPAGDRAFELVNSATRSELIFYSRGVVGPLGAGSLWRVRLSTKPSGLELEALPVEADAPPIRGTIQALSRFVVRARRMDDHNWTDSWDSQQFPAAVEIAFRDSAGLSRSPSLIVSTDLESR